MMNMMNPQMRNMLKQLKSNPKEFIQLAGASIPEEMMNDPQAMVQHMIMTGQVSNPVLQRIMPMIRQLSGK